MPTTPPFNKHETQIAFLKEAVPYTGGAIAGVNQWLGHILDEQTIPYPKVEQKEYRSGSKTIEAHTLAADNQAGAQILTVAELHRVYEGSLHFSPQDFYMFEHIFGGVVSTGAGPYVNEFFAGTDESRPLPTFTLAVFRDKDADAVLDAGDGDYSHSFNGCKVNKCTITFNEKEELKIDLDIVAAGWTVETGFPVGLSANRTDLNFLTKYGGSLTLGGATFAKIQQGTIEIDHAIESKYYTSGDPQYHREGFFTATATLLVEITNITLFTAAAVSPLADVDFGITFTRAAGDTVEFTSDDMNATPIDAGTPQYVFNTIGGEGEMTQEVTVKLHNLRAEVTHPTINYAA